MTAWAVIGGSAPLTLTERFRSVEVGPGAYGVPSAPVTRGRIGGCEVLFLPRHGVPHHIAPHLINNRANVDALCGLGARGIIALNTVGGISGRAPAGSVFLPHQIIDYTWGRAHTFSDESNLIHADFADPVDDSLRLALLAAARAAGVEVCDGGVYGCTQGPRFETAAEIERMAQDGCDLVGMTAMPEAALARERGLPYAMVSLVVNPAAGRAVNPFDLTAIAEVAAEGMTRVEQLLGAFFQSGEGG